MNNLEEIQIGSSYDPLQVLDDLEQHRDSLDREFEDWKDSLSSRDLDNIERLIPEIERFQKRIDGLRNSHNHAIGIAFQGVSKRKPHVVREWLEKKIKIHPDWDSFDVPIGVACHTPCNCQVDNMDKEPFRIERREDEFVHVKCGEPIIIR